MDPGLDRGFPKFQGKRDRRLESCLGRHQAGARKMASDTPVLPNVAHIPTLPPDFDWTRPSKRLILVTRWIRLTFKSSI